jgi:hypothetical protein
MKTIQILILLLALSSLSAAQAASAPAPAPNNSIAASSSMSPVLSDLDRLQTAASQTNSQLAYMHIDKWKADAASKQQAQTNADSIQRNLTEALPALIGSVRSAPQDVSAQFKLYRNLNALYDVLASLTESAGAFGPKNDYNALAQQLGVIDSVRRNLGDELEQLTSSTQSQLNQLRAQVQTLQQHPAAAATPPKKVVVDDTEPPKKTTHKKKPAPQPTTSGTDSSSSAPSSSSGSNSPPPPKQQ